MTHAPAQLDADVPNTAWDGAPLVSVIITTCGRPQLVGRAIQSALAQDWPCLEVIVVLDGPDPASVAAIRQVTDPRVRLLELPQNRGVATARNNGLAQARGEWVALLDDDDEWHPAKLARQWQAARDAALPLPLVATGFIRDTGTERVSLPRRAPRPDEPLGDYLFTRESPFRDDGMLLVTTLFFPRALWERVSFDPLDNLHEDWRWLLEVAALPGFGLVFLPELLATWHTADDRVRRSNSGDWQTAMDWAKSMRPRLSARAYAGYLCGIVAPRAAAAHTPAAIKTLIRELRASGAARPRDWARLAAIFLLPQAVRNVLRRVYDTVVTPRRAGRQARSNTST